VKAELQEVIHDGKDCEVPNIKRCNASATPRPRWRWASTPTCFTTIWKLLRPH